MDIAQKSLQHVWHPCSQMKDYETFAPLEIVKAYGSYLQLADGGKLLDAFSSWWCKSLGHGDQRIAAAVTNQMNHFEHVILANTTNKTIVALSEKLAGLTESLNKVMYASDGSCAVEMALKMSFDYHRLTGNPQKTKVATLQGAYHGETFLAMAVSDMGLYRGHYQHILPDVTVISDLPLVNSSNDAAWADCGDAWPGIKAQLDQQADTLAAVIVEPILQAANGMNLYSPNLLKCLRHWCDKHNVHLVADEIVTAFGRTGRWLACEHAGITPDFLVLGKGLTSGWLPLSAVVTSDIVYDAFYDDYETGKAFLHSHTHSGNALAAAAALATIDIIEKDNIVSNTAQQLGPQLLESYCNVAEVTGKLTNIRGVGGMVAGDLILDDQQSKKRVGYAVYQEAVKRGVLLRPLGNTIYWLPPLNIASDDVAVLERVTAEAINTTLS